MKSSGKRIMSGLVLAAALFVGARKVGPMPPLGPLLHPTAGIWAVAAERDFPRTLATHIPGMRDSVRVVFDDRAVPHIFATNPEDAFRALGYVVARSRLFQLELQWRATAGRLSEMLGKDVLRFDESQRALGLAWSAQRDWARRDTTDPAIKAIEAYAQGVNARIAEINRHNLPLEYRLIDRTPAPWQPVYSFYLLKQMGYTLTFDRSDLALEHLREIVGDSVVAALRPRNSPIQQPIVPAPWAEPRDAFEPIPVPMHEERAPAAGGAEAAAGQRGRVAGDLAAALTATLPPCHGVVEGLSGAPSGKWCGSGGLPVGRSVEDAIGSNNWAVAPWRSATHDALLAGDPHLDLTLPSIWYEAHLIVDRAGWQSGRVGDSASSAASATLPGQGGAAGLDVYGVTIPGEPSVVIGFNRHVAWSFTNTGADVVDFYSEVLDDSAQPAHYLVDGRWKRLHRRIERYYGRSGHVLATDTLYSTDRGPLIRSGERAFSMRWTVLEKNTTDSSLAAVVRAGDVSDWMNAFAGYDAPAQNAVVADDQGNIAIRSTGTFPIRPGGGSGVPVRDGTTSASDWTGVLPVSQYPFAENPKQGYLASANQQPWDPKMDSTYLGTNWPPPWRALRINQLLAADTAVTVDAMRSFQTDPGSARADEFEPVFVHAAARIAHAGGVVPGVNLRKLSTAARLLSEWDRRYTKTNERAILFELAMHELEQRVWDELRVPSATGGTRLLYLPSTSVLAELVADSTSWWWDDHHTKPVETRDDIFALSLVAAYDTAVARYGSPDAGGWQWSKVHHANVFHLLHLRSLSALDIPVQGGPGTLNPSSGVNSANGPSWRMVVELGPTIRAWSIYPGGQSGNPVSRYYADRIQKWSDGELDPVFFPRTPAELEAKHTLATFTLTGGK